MSRSMKVMVVDDSETNRLLLKEMLKGKAEIDEAEDGFGAWKLYTKSLDEKRYDILLLDIAMPRMDGIKLLKLIRENENCATEQKLPILVITAHKEKVESAQKEGCDDYMLKPVTIDALFAKINTLTNSDLAPL